jgi:hypothetical protein
MYGDWPEWKRRVWERWEEHGKHVQAAVCCRECWARRGPCSGCRAPLEAWAVLLGREAGGVVGKPASKEVLARAAAR